MLFGLILRNYKTYQSINYIPISNGNKFSAFVGENGAGKSSVLEALNSFFNSTEWNLHHTLSKGYQTREPFVCPIFIIEKEKFKIEQQWLLDGISKIAWETNLADFNASVRSHAELFCKHRNTLISEKIDPEKYYLIPVGLQKNTPTTAPTIYFSIFESLNSFSLLTKYTKFKDAKQELLSEILKYYKYIYLPSEIDYIEYTKIEGATIQALLGEKLEQIVRKFIKKEAIIEINKKLGEFLNQISTTLVDYQYKKPAKKQNLVTQSHFTEKIIEAYFESKVLNRNTDKEAIPVKNLSSGEKRKALIDIAKAFLSEKQPESQQVVLAIDEPELSLHVSSAFKQFENLKKVSTAGTQVIITTHWYGFMPIVSDGIAIYCTKSSSPLRTIDLRCFREEIKKLRTESKGALPIELELKGVTDLVHSIVSSIIKSDYRWIICEGSADKIYLDHYLSGSNINVLAVGGSPAVKKIYNLINIAIEGATDDAKGRVFFLLDTDKHYEAFKSSDGINCIRIRRLKNNHEKNNTELLETSNNDFFPPTVVEDTLPIKPFIETLAELKNSPEYQEAINAIDLSATDLDTNAPSAIAMDLRAKDRERMDELFEKTGFKVAFALKFKEIADRQPRPLWIEEILAFLFPPRKPRRKGNKQD